MDSEEFSYDSEEINDYDYEDSPNLTAKHNIHDNAHDNEEDKIVVELTKDDLFDLIIRRECELEENCKIDYQQLDQDSQELVMEEIVDNMIGYAMKSSGYIIGWYPRSYAEHLASSRLRGHISEEKYNGVIHLIETSLQCSDINVQDKIRALSTFTGANVSDINEKIIVAWNPTIGFRTPVINLN